MSSVSKTPEDTRRPIFSDTVDQLAQSEPPDDMTLYAVLRALRAVLVVELKRRGVWQAPPSYLRMLGTSWMANGGEALDELTQDAYLYVFAQRLATLIESRQRGHDVGPLVILMVRQLISHRQRLADPVGYCVYSRLHEAVLRLVEAGQLHVADGGERIHNRTMFCFAPPERGADPTPIGAESLAAMVSTWVEPLLPELVTALSRAVIPLIEELQKRVQSLQAEGVETFRFGQLVAPLKREVRQRWHAVWGQEAGEIAFDDTEEGEGFAEAVPIAWSQNPVEYESLLDCVNDSIGRHQPRQQQGSLWHLWLLVRGAQHRDDEPGGDAPRRVSVAGVAKLLEVSRRQVGNLLKALQGMVTTCLSAFERPNHPSIKEPNPASPGEPTHDPDHTAPRTENAGR